MCRMICQSTILRGERWVAEKRWVIPESRVTWVRRQVSRRGPVRVMALDVVRDVRRVNIVGCHPPEGGQCRRSHGLKVVCSNCEHQISSMLPHGKNCLILSWSGQGKQVGETRIRTQSAFRRGTGYVQRPSQGPNPECRVSCGNGIASGWRAHDLIIGSAQALHLRTRVFVIYLLSSEPYIYSGVGGAALVRTRAPRG